MLLGISREDTLPLPPLLSELSSSQQTALQYIVDILSTMDIFSDEYNEDEIDVDHECHSEVGSIMRNLFYEVHLFKISLLKQHFPRNSTYCLIFSFTSSIERVPQSRQQLHYIFILMFYLHKFQYFLFCNAFVL